LTFGVKYDINYKVLMDEYEFLKTGANDYERRFKKIKNKAFNDYMNELVKLNK